MTNSYPEGLSLSALEERVSTIWRDVLGAAANGSEATFFELQGQSISAVRIATRIEDELGVAVDVGILFEDPTLSEFVCAVAQAWTAENTRTEVA